MRSGPSFALDLERDGLEEYVVARSSDETYLIRLHRPGFIARVNESDEGSTGVRVLAWLDSPESNAHGHREHPFAGSGSGWPLTTQHKARKASHSRSG